MGYAPICDAMNRWAMLLGFPPQQQYRLLWSGARRLDSAHLQIERVRSGIEGIAPEGSIAFGEDVHRIIGDAELAVTALDKGLDVAVSLHGRFQIARTMPPVVTQKRPLIGRLRDHYEHIDERALGLIWGKPDPAAEDAWNFEKIFTERAFTDGQDSLGIDAEATELCIAARGYLLGGWTELVAREHEAQAAAANATGA